MDFGGRGLFNANLEIPQGSSFPLVIKHVDDESGDPIDHSRSTAKMAFVYEDGEVTDLSECCTCTSTGVTIHVTATASSALEIGKYVWDLAVETETGDVIIMAYGKVKVTETYSTHLGGD